jgi:hypothetical protein
VLIAVCAVGAISALAVPLWERAGTLQAKQVSLFQIRQYYSGDKGEPDVPH